MKASELIEKIHNGEIKPGTKIICHKKNEHFDYKTTRWFMGNWFSKVPPEEHRSSSDSDDNMILNLCDESVTYKIEEEPIPLKPFKDYLEDLSIESEYTEEFKEYIHQLSLKVNYLLEKESDK